ncbi:hypothetical protein LOTGIDRAFT_126524, partial [Lottia gigantea]
GETPLHIACIKNDVRRVKQLLTVPGINVNAVDNYGWSPLHEACNHGHIECVELLLKYCPAKTVDSYFNGITPLHDAVMTGWTDICQLLLKYGGRYCLSMSYIVLCIMRTDSNDLQDFNIHLAFCSF